jgi:cytochrome c-type biogenesis protein CcmE
MNIKWKVILGVVTLITVSAYLALVGAATSWQYYVTVDECVADAASFASRRVRVNGQVDAASLTISEDRQFARFVLRGSRCTLQVVCAGPIPDNLAEHMDVVVEGVLLDAHLFRASRVITRCASKYQSQGGKG